MNDERKSFFNTRKKVFESVLTSKKVSGGYESNLGPAYLPSTSGSSLLKGFPLIFFPGKNGSPGGSFSLQRGVHQGQAPYLKKRVGGGITSGEEECPKKGGDLVPEKRKLYRSEV